jgi:phosphatidylserine decarboxylase
LINFSIAGFVLAALALFITYFFRNPSRTAPDIDGAAVAPADGKIIEVKKETENNPLGGEGIKVSIFMSVLNVHINRMPMSGKITDILYKKGDFKPAFDHESSGKNEQNALIVQIDDGQQLAVVQVAGVIARRIVCWIRKGDMLQRGQRFGFIRFGSRIDCYFPVNFEIDVSPGQRVKGGETILGYIR